MAAAGWVARLVMAVDEWAVAETDLGSAGRGVVRVVEGLVVGLVVEGKVAARGAQTARVTRAVPKAA